MKNQSYEKAVSVKTARNFSVVFVAQAAMIAALYVVLTFIANTFGLANYAIQVRISEALTILPYFTPAAIPGLVIGCLLSNILTGCILPDIIFGSIATLIGALGTYALRKFKWFAPVTPILANALIVPLVLIYGYGFLLDGVSTAYCYGYYFITVGIGEIISCGILGMLLLLTLEKYKNKIFA
ncbi:MAG: QueT transporter family protein [Lachnospiraceae bacterium]|nr:QueT transporter family protein [Lachnospiraceae bacterium]